MRNFKLIRPVVRGLSYIMIRGTIPNLKHESNGWTFIAISAYKNVSTEQKFVIIEK